ncbi:MAG: LCP family protein [Lactimicrobium massiliense]|nr:LCP family protein [Lactimicrobium massiliense]MDD6229595.1 LCP family protein [Lactimicrobium massiliense]
MRNNDSSVENTEKIDVSEITSKSRKSKKKKTLNPILFWFITYIAAIVFVSIFYNMPMFPHKWTWYALAVLAVILTGLYLLTKWKKSPRILMRVINLALACALAILSCLMPIYKAKVSNVIKTNSEAEENYILMNLYVMSDSYKEAHADLFVDETSFTVKDDDLENLKYYSDATFITTMGIDQDNQRNALNEVKNLLDQQSLNVIDKDSVTDAVAALYQNEAQVLILNQDYVSMVTDQEKYANFASDTRVLYTIRLTSDVSVATSDSELTSKPFSIFFGGNDQEGELSLSGRTDVDMVVTVNPTSHQILISSFPRDSLVPNPALNNSPDKLTHLGLSGLQNTMTELSSLLGTPINNYVLINFTTFRTIIDALDGVDVDNPYAFGFTFNSNVWFEQGNIHLDGDDALCYVRERYSLPDGDFGRTMHQQLVMKAIIAKLTSSAVITKFDSLLTALKGTFLTNLTDSSIYALCQKQLEENTSWNVVNYHVLGTTGTSVCASSGSTPLSVVLPYANQISFIKSEIDKVEAGETITQQDLPEGYGVLVEAVGGSNLGSDDTENYEESRNADQNQYQEQQPAIQQPVVTSEPQQEVPSATGEPAAPSNNESSENVEVSGNGGETNSGAEAAQGSETGTDSAG